MVLSINTSKTLHNGVEMPIFGLGTFQSTSKVAIKAVQYALDIGYRHIDTATFYENEAAIGKAIQESDVPRDEIFIVTKLWNSDHGYEKAKKAFERSLDKLGLDYIDLYLIHWPVEDLRMESWRALEEKYAEEKAKAIGVSNYTINHLREVIQEGKIVPMVNQVEFHPWLYQLELLDFCEANNIALEAYSPLVKGERIDHNAVTKIAKKYNKTNAQILIRWGLQHDVIEIPKSSNPERIKENCNIFDFTISNEDMEELNSLNEDYHCTWDPTGVP